MGELRVKRGGNRSDAVCGHTQLFILCNGLSMPRNKITHPPNPEVIIKKAEGKRCKCVTM